MTNADTPTANAEPTRANAAQVATIDHRVAAIVACGGDDDAEAVDIVAKWLRDQAALQRLLQGVTVLMARHFNDPSMQKRCRDSFAAAADHSDLMLREALAGWTPPCWRDPN